MSGTGGPHGGTAPLDSLLTVFNPPCPTSWLVTTTKVPSQYPAFPTAAAQASCDPPQWDLNLDDQGFQYYSPAICPGGFSVGPSCGIVGRTRTQEGFPAVEAGETVMWCVPSGMACTSDTTDFRGGIWGIMTTASGPGALATVGPALQIRWREEDLAALETHPLTPGLRPGGKSNTEGGGKSNTRPGPGPPQPPAPPPPPPPQSTVPAATPTPIQEGFRTIVSPTAIPASSPAATSTPARSGTATESSTISTPSSTNTDRSGSPPPSTSSSTDTPAPEMTSSAPNSAVAFSSPSSVGPLTVIIIASVLSGILLIILTFLLLRRRLLKRRSRGDDPSGWDSPSRQVGLGVWLRRPGGRSGTSLAGRSYGARTGTGSSHHRRGSSQTPLFGMSATAVGDSSTATGPYGTVGNPAELVDEHAVEAATAATIRIHEKPESGDRECPAELGDNRESDNRASWVSRVFRARRSWLFPPASPATITTTTTATNPRSDSRMSRSSRWTQKTASGDWEAFVRECEDGGVPRIPDGNGGWSWNLDPKGKGKELTAALAVLQKPQNVRIVGTGGAGMGPVLGPDGGLIRRGTLGEKMAGRGDIDKGKEKELDTHGDQEKSQDDAGLLKPGRWDEDDEAARADNRFSFDRVSEGTFGKGRLSGGARTTGS